MKSTESPERSLTEDDITKLVQLFYARVRRDPTLSPVFIGKIGETDSSWAVHSKHIEDFWSSVLLKTKRFTGNPMLKHIALPGITPHHFKLWLEIFELTADETLIDAHAHEVKAMAHRIAQSLQMGLAFHHERSGQSPHPFTDYSAISRPR